jgi:DNA-directed RNA polymerase specialized sigma24 family protein
MSGRSTPRPCPGSLTTPAPDIVAHLNADWATLQLEPPNWPTGRGATLGDLLAAIPGQPDTVLTELICACQAGHPLAGRVVVQAFLGKIVLMARADTRLTTDDLVATLWLRVAAYPLARRPQRIAANLVLDARKDALAESRSLGLLPAPEPVDELDARRLLQVARRLDLVSPQSLDIATSVYADGLTSASAAQRHRLSAEAVRWRCSDTVRRLRPHRAVLAAACAASHPVQLVAAA